MAFDKEEVFECAAGVPGFEADTLTLDGWGNFVWLTNSRPKNGAAVSVALDAAQAKRLAKLLKGFAKQKENVR